MKKIKLIVILTIVALFFANSNIVQAKPSEDICKDAYNECLIDGAIAALLALLGGGPALALIVGASYETWCLIGYTWCKQYYKV